MFNKYQPTASKNVAPDAGPRILGGKNPPRKRDKNSAQNFAIHRKIVINLLKQEDPKKLSRRTKRLKAGWDNNFLLKILKI